MVDYVNNHFEYFLPGKKYSRESSFTTARPYECQVFKKWTFLQNPSLGTDEKISTKFFWRHGNIFQALKSTRGYNKCPRWYCASASKRSHKGEMPRCWYLVACFLCFWKLMLPQFEVNVTKSFSRYTKRQFQQRLVIPPLKQTLLGNTYPEEKYFEFF